MIQVVDGIWILFNGLTKALLFYTLSCSIVFERFQSVSADNGYEGIKLNASGLIRLRNYQAKDYFVYTPDGYRLNLIQAWNQLNFERSAAAQLDVVLFIHGVHTLSKFFLVNSIGAKPVDLSHLKFNSSSSDEQMIEKISVNGGKNSLAFTLLNLGHQVWFLNRRGADGSRGHASSIVGNEKSGAKHEEMLENFKQTENSRFWNYSMDEQAKFDIPLVVEYILNSTRRAKLTIVSHSAGGAITLMSLVKHPSLIGKLSKVILWAPALHLGGYEPIDTLTYRFGNYICQSFVAPLPEPVVLPVFRDLVTLACSTDLAQETICRWAMNNNYGFGGDQENSSPGILASALDTVTTHEYAQLIQSYLNSKTAEYDHGWESMNLIAHNQTKPPVYDLSTIRGGERKIAIFYGVTDSLVRPTAIDSIADEIKFPILKHFINQPGAYFNHYSFSSHKNITKLLILPTLKFLYS